MKHKTKVKVKPKSKVPIPDNKRNFATLKSMTHQTKGDVKVSVFDVKKDLRSFEDYSANQSLIDGKINIRCGNLERFESYLKSYKDNKREFTVIGYGLTKKIIYGQYVFLFYGAKGQKKPQGIHLVSLVKKDIDKLIQSGFKIPKIPKTKPYLTSIHKENCFMYDIGVEALAIDVNHCYWRTAFLLGYITEKTYNKGIANPDYKEGRLIAIGALGKIVSIQKYSEGQKKNEYSNEEDYVKYGGFYWAVISKVSLLLVELAQKLGKDFLMFLTDCAIVNPSRRDEVIAIMKKHGYTSKEYTLCFTEISESKICWETENGDKKQIIYNRALEEADNKNLTSDKY